MNGRSENVYCRDGGVLQCLRHASGQCSSSELSRIADQRRIRRSSSGRTCSIRLKSNLAALPILCTGRRSSLAIADVQAFIDRDTVRQPKLSEVIDVRAAKRAASGASPKSLVKTETLEVRRLTLPKGRKIPTHHAPGEITVHCLEGRIAFTANGETRDVGAGQLIVLAAGEPHSLVGLEDSTVLVTKVLLARPSEK